MLGKGLTPMNGVRHEPDTFLWHPNLSRHMRWRLLRISYYVSVAGDDSRLAEVRSKIAGTKYQFESLTPSAVGRGYLNPRVFKKKRKTQKSKSVDVSIVIDMLRNAYNDSVDNLYLLSGDGDYIPVIEEVMRQGKQVFVAAFSSGCHPDLRHISDEFHELDAMFLGPA